MSALGARLAKEYPNEDPGRGITVMACSDVRVHPQIDVVLTAIASLLLVAVGLVLAIACSNLATLLPVRGVARAKEIEVSVRLGLGATRAQLVRHLMAESLLPALAGGAAGCPTVPRLDRLDRRDTAAGPPRSWLPDAPGDRPRRGPRRS